MEWCKEFRILSINMEEMEWCKENFFNEYNLCSSIVFWIKVKIFLLNVLIPSIPLVQIPIELFSSFIGVVFPRLFPLLKFSIYFT